MTDTNTSPAPWVDAALADKVREARALAEAATTIWDNVTEAHLLLGMTLEAALRVPRSVPGAADVYDVVSAAYAAVFDATDALAPLCNTIREGGGEDPDE